MAEGIKKKLRLLVVIAIGAFLVWFFIVSPMITFKTNESKLEKAARRYYELNNNKLPTGERVGTVSLTTLYHESYIEKDLYIPHTKKTCSITDSWVKVRRENGEYKYYVYLECGVMKSSIDHKGPEIKLNGETDITIGLGEEFKDPGIKSVVDNKDGKLKIEDVDVKGKVDTSKVGMYEIKYTAFDNLKNKTIVSRNVSVVQKLSSTVKKALGDEKVYKGDPENYIYFSNNLFRIVGFDGKNIKIIANIDVANVNYDGIEDWLKYYENHLTKASKDLIVETKYCNMNITDEDFNKTDCTSYSKKKKIGIISIDEVNRSIYNKYSFLSTSTISWTANAKDKSNAYALRDYFMNSDDSYMSFEKKHNFGVRPVITIKGDVLITGGEGTKENPYYLEDYQKAKKNDLVNTRYSGEYISYAGYTWRIVDTYEDGTTKILLNQSLRSENGILFTTYKNLKNKIYNPNEDGNVGYYFNNKISQYIDTRYFVNHEFEVPIYKGEPNYNKETSVKTYKAKLMAPNMYEMYSALPDDPFANSYWLVNSNKDVNEINSVSQIGVVMYGADSREIKFGIRPAGYLNQKCFITSGNGTADNPYIISK